MIVPCAPRQLQRRSPKRSLARLRAQAHLQSSSSVRPAVMEKLLSSGVPHETLPDSFVLPADQRPPASSATVVLPVIDLSAPRDEVRRAVLEAGKELGFFQVVNHGVLEQAVQDMEACGEEFFRLPAEDKAAFYSEDTDRPSRLFTGATYDTGSGERYWRDCLRMVASGGFPVTADAKDTWPEKPDGIREATERFITTTRRLGMELLRLLCEGLGLRPDYFEGDLSAGDLVVNVNHYPPCPDPARTMGLQAHGDRGLITLLLQGGVAGLQVYYHGDWIRVPPLPGAFVVNFGQQLEIATNGLLKSVEHRAVPNAAVPRTSLVTFIVPTDDCLVGPAVELAVSGSRARYRAVVFREFMRVYEAAGARREGVEKAFKI